MKIPKAESAFLTFSLGYRMLSSSRYAFATLAGLNILSGPVTMGCKSYSCFAALSRPTVARTSCLQYSTSSKSTCPLGLWSSLPGIPNSLHPVFNEYDLLRSAQSRVRTSRNRATGQSSTLLLFFPGSDRGARVEWIIAVLLLRALMTARGKNLLALSSPVFGLRHCDRMSDHPPLFAVSQSRASLLKSKPELKHTMSALA